MHYEPSELAARRAQLQEHVNLALDRVRGYAVVLLDERGIIVAWNRGAERMLGHSADEVIGQPSDIFFVEEDRQAGIPTRELEIAARTGDASDDRWHLRRDGSRFFGSGLVTAARDTAGGLLGFVKIFRDLTTERHAQERLAESEERYRLLVNSISDYAIFMLDGEGRVSYWTDAAERIKGYTAAEIIGKPFATFFTQHDRDRGVPERELQTARETGKAEGSGWRIRKDGGAFWADEIATALFDASGAHIGYSKITRDNTDRRRAELERERLLREATESNRLKDEFLSTISHELRTPLNAILGWVQLIRLREPSAESLPEALAVIERNARAQARLIEDLLDVSRIITGKTELAMVPVAFAEPLAAAIETVRPSAEQKGVQLSVRHDVAQDALKGDPERLQQIVWNVLTNAVKFTPAGGRVEVATASRNHVIELTVTDTGVGIDPAFLPFVFDRFRQGDTAHSREHRGLGLGLSIVKHLVELHGGRVAVESPGRGMGTTVRVTLPRLLPRPDAEASGDITPGENISSHSHLRLDDATVLVVEDEPDARRILELALLAHGAKVSCAGSAADAMAMAMASPPDLVVSDLSMPGEDGFMFLSQLRAAAQPALQSVPVVAITAHARAEDRDRAITAGFARHIPKPVDVTQVVAMLSDLLNRP